MELIIGVICLIVVFIILSRHRIINFINMNAEKIPGVCIIVFVILVFSGISFVALCRPKNTQWYIIADNETLTTRMEDFRYKLIVNWNYEVGHLILVPDENRSLYTSIDDFYFIVQIRYFPNLSKYYITLEWVYFYPPEVTNPKYQIPWNSPLLEKIAIDS